MSQIWNSVLQNTAAIFQLKIVGKERTRTAGSEGLKDSSHFCSSYKTNTLGREAGESAGMRAKVDEVWAVEKCSVTGARPVHLVVQLLYGLLWEDGTGLFKHEKRQKTESHCCDLKRGAVWQADCHPNLAGLKAESSERGAAKSEWGWDIDVLFFAETQDCQLSVLVEQLFFPCKWLLTVGENSQIKWYKFLFMLQLFLATPCLLISCHDSSAQAPFCPLQRQGHRVWLPCSHDHWSPFTA